MPDAPQARHLAMLGAKPRSAPMTVLRSEFARSEAAERLVAIMFHPSTLSKRASTTAGIRETAIVARAIDPGR
jgi:hypothetical protein